MTPEQQTFIEKTDRAVFLASQKVWPESGGYRLSQYNRALTKADPAPLRYCRRVFAWLTREALSHGKALKILGGDRGHINHLRSCKPFQPLLEMGELLAIATRHMPKPKNGPDRKWTMVEIAELKNSMHLSVPALAERFGCTEAAAREARQRHVGPAVKRWSPDEVQFLRDNSALPNKEIAQILGRSEGSVQKNRKKHGIKANPPYRWTKKRYHKTTFDITTVSVRFSSTHQPKRHATAA